MIDISIYGISAVVLTGILVEVAKRAEVPTKYLPLISLVAGILIVSLGTWTLSVEGILTGIVIGAIASGIYDVGKKGVDIIVGK